MYVLSDYNVIMACAAHILNSYDGVMRIMKRVRKLLSGVIVLSLLLSLATVGFAEDTTEPVTASADAGTPSSIKEVDGSITVSAEGGLLAAEATAKGADTTAELSVAGNVTAIASTDGTGEANNASAGGVLARAIDGGSVEATVGGNVSATATGGNSASAGGIGINRVYGDGISYNGTVTMNVAGDVTTSASTSGDSASATSVTALERGGATDVTIGGDISSTSSAANESTAQGVYSYSTAALSLVVDGDITATANGESAYASGMEFMGPGLSVSVSGDVSATARGNDASESSAIALGIISENAETLTVKGEVYASADAASADAVGLGVSSTNGQKSEVTVSGGVTASAIGADGDYNTRGTGVSVNVSDGGNAAVAVDGDISVSAQSDAATYAVGVSAYPSSEESNDGSYSISVDGNITVTAENSAEEEGNPVEAYGLNVSEADSVNVSGAITVSASSLGSANNGYGTSLDLGAGGVVAYSSLESSEVTIGGDVTVNGVRLSVDDSTYYDTILSGVAARARESGNLDVTVGGDVVVNAEVPDGAVTGISGTTAGDSTDAGNSVLVTANGVSVSSTDGGNVVGTFLCAGENSAVEIVIGENGITVIGGDEATGIQIASLGGTHKVNVAGNINSDDIGIAINDFSETLMPDKTDVLKASAIIDILVEGTVTGENSSVQLGTAELAENTTLTVWKAELNEDNRVVTAGEEASDEAAKELEANILYIIKLEQPDSSQGSVTLAGVVDSHGFDTAKEGDIVTLKTMVQEGYQLVGAFNGIDTKTSLMQDADGNYYLVVPKGGGVYLSVQLEKIETTPVTPVTPVTPTVDPTPAVEPAASTTPFVFPLNWPIYNLPVVQPGILAQAGTIPSLRGYDIDLRRSLLTGSYYLMTPRDGSRVPSAILEDLAREVEEMEGVNGVGIVVKFKQAKPSGADENLILEAIGDKTVAAWLDASSALQGTGAATGKMLLQVAVPDDILALAKDGAAFEVYHVENGKAVGTPAVYNPDTETIDFETGFIGVFALVYSKAVAAGV